MCLLLCKNENLIILYRERVKKFLHTFLSEIHVTFLSERYMILFFLTILQNSNHIKSDNNILHHLVSIFKFYAKLIKYNIIYISYILNE